MSFSFGSFSPSHRTPSLSSFSGWLSLGQLITWGSVFYAFAVLMAPLEQELGLTRVGLRMKLMRLGLNGDTPH